MKKLIVGCFIMGVLCLLLSFPTTEHYVKAEEVVIKKEVKIVKKSNARSNYRVRELTEVEKSEIERIFGSNAKIATAVLKHESGFRLDAKNWNCWYYRENGKKYSTSCKTTDRHLAWSVDCGMAQVNTRGKDCPAHLLTLEGNMEAVERIYKTQGLNAWVSYKSGAYVKFL